MGSPRHEILSFTDDERDEIEAKLKSFKFSPCVVCQSKLWTFSDFVSLFAPTLPGKAYPLLPLSCDTCGNTFLLNLIILGVPKSFLARLKGLDSDEKLAVAE